MRIGDRESHEADGVLGIIYLAQQLEGEALYLRSPLYYLICCEATSDLLKVVKLYLQCQRIALEGMALESAQQLLHGASELFFHLQRVANVLQERMSTAYRLADAEGLHRALVDATRKVVIHTAHLAKVHL